MSSSPICTPLYTHYWTALEQFTSKMHTQPFDRGLINEEVRHLDRTAVWLHVSIGGKTSQTFGMIQESSHVFTIQKADFEN